jgi:hypothetical protein
VGEKLLVSPQRWLSKSIALLFSVHSATFNRLSRTLSSMHPSMHGDCPPRQRMARESVTETGGREGEGEREKEKEKERDRENDRVRSSMHGDCCPLPLLSIDAVFYEFVNARGVIGDCCRRAILLRSRLQSRDDDSNASRDDDSDAGRPGMPATTYRPAVLHGSPACRRQKIERE